MAALPRVLLLGDSIRISYQPTVAEQLQGTARVVGPSDNCQYSLYTLSSLGRWLAELGEPAVIHWNNGLHDIGHNPHRVPVQMPLEVYRGNLEHILRQLRAITPHVIWATTTPVHPNRPFTTEQWAWRNAEIDQYNQAALALMHSQHVPVNDLHALVSEDLDGYLAEDQLHLSEAGQQQCARAVADTVSQYL